MAVDIIQNYLFMFTIRGTYFNLNRKREGFLLSPSHLLHFYTTVIRPVLEYASPLWHPTLTKSQTEHLEAVQRRALKIIFCYSSSTSYLTTLELAGILSLQARRVDLSKRFLETFVNLITVYTIFSHPRVTQL